MQAADSTITLSPAMHTALQQAANRRGIKPDAYVEELLTQTLTTEFQMGDDVSKPYSVLDFYGVAPSGRSATEIDAEINALRDEWDNE